MEKNLSQEAEGWNLRFSWGHLLPLERLVHPLPLRPTPSQPLRLEWIYCRASGWHQHTHTHTHGATRYFKYLSHLLAYLWQRNSIRIKWQKEYSGLFFLLKLCDSFLNSSHFLWSRQQWYQTLVLLVVPSCGSTDGIPGWTWGIMTQWPRSNTRKQHINRQDPEKSISHIPGHILPQPLR